MLVSTTTTTKQTKHILYICYYTQHISLKTSIYVCLDETTYIFEVKKIAKRSNYRLWQEQRVKMTAINHMITITKEQEEFLLDHPDLKLSKIAQKGIEELIQNYNISTTEIKDMQKKITNWQNIANKQRDFIERKGLMDDMLKEDGF